MKLLCRVHDLEKKIIAIIGHYGVLDCSFFFFFVILYLDKNYSIITNHKNKEQHP